MLPSWWKTYTNLLSFNCRFNPTHPPSLPLSLLSLSWTLSKLIERIPGVLPPAGRHRWNRPSWINHHWNEIIPTSCCGGDKSNVNERPPFNLLSVCMPFNERYRPARRPKRCGWTSESECNMGYAIVYTGTIGIGRVWKERVTQNFNEGVLPQLLIEVLVYFCQFCLWEIQSPTTATEIHFLLFLRITSHSSTPKPKWRHKVGTPAPSAYRISHIAVAHLGIWKGGLHLLPLPSPPSPPLLSPPFPSHHPSFPFPLHPFLPLRSRTR